MQCRKCVLTIVILKWAEIKNIRIIEYYAIYNLKALDLLFKKAYNIANKMFHVQLVSIMQAKSNKKKLSERPSRSLSFNRKKNHECLIGSSKSNWTVLEYFHCQAILFIK
jgi:hypothetical protein